MTWGLVPSWAKERRGSGHVNARAETVAEKPSFRPSIAHKRCLIPMDGYYEWRTVEDANAPLAPSGKTPKRAVYVTRTDGRPMAVAGLWSTWRSPDNGPTIRTCCVITTSANEKLAGVHDRMPVVVESNDWSVWLGDDPVVGDDSLGPALDLLIPAENMTLTMIDVGPLVNSVRNNGIDLIQPIAFP
jgi:putative SOS response-associated peptidase YedK